MDKRIRICVVDGSGLHDIKVRDELEVYQSIVNGYIECAARLEGNVLCFANEEGILLGYDEWCIVTDVRGSDVPVYGPCFFVRTDGEDFASLTETDIRLIERSVTIPVDFRVIV